MSFRFSYDSFMDSQLIPVIHLSMGGRLSGIEIQVGTEQLLDHHQLVLGPNINSCSYHRKGIAKKELRSQTEILGISGRKLGLGVTIISD